MKGDVRVAPNGGVIIHKGLSTKAWFRAFSTGTVVGGAAGFVGGFALAQTIYSDEHQRDSVRPRGQDHGGRGRGVDARRLLCFWRPVIVGAVLARTSSLSRGLRGGSTALRSCRLAT